MPDNAFKAAHARALQAATEIYLSAPRGAIRYAVDSTIRDYLTAMESRGYKLVGADMMPRARFDVLPTLAQRLDATDG